MLGSITMNLKISTTLTLSCLLLLCGDVSQAQKQQVIRADWLAMDVANMERLLPQLKQHEPLTITALEKIFGTPVYVRALGFGGRTFIFSKPGGYAYIRVSGFVFNDTVGDYTISVNWSTSWSQIRSTIIESSKRNTDLEFKEEEFALTQERQFPDVVAAYKKAVSAELGEMATVTVPQYLKDAYQVLLSLGNPLVLGDGPCDYGAVIPRGKRAIDAIVAAHRTDLMSNILKGYNPGGRVYAAVALKAVEQEGLKLSPDVLRALEVVRGLDIDLEICSGCIHSHLKAKQIIDEWRAPAKD